MKNEIKLIKQKGSRTEKPHTALFPFFVKGYTSTEPERGGIRRIHLFIKPKQEFNKAL